jgi:acyl-CoA thioesterase
MGGEADHADGATAVPAGRIDEALAKAAFLGALETYSQKFGTFFLAKLLGLDIGFTEHSCVVEMEVHDYMFNPQGSLHGGVISTILDISMGHLLNHKAGPGATLEMKVQFVRAVRRGRVRCEATFIKQGRTVSYIEARLVDDEQRPLAVGTSTWQLLRHREATAS